MSYRIAWTTAHGELVAITPTQDEVIHHAAALTAAYNDPQNAPLLGHDEPILEDEIADIYAAMRIGGAPFLFLLDDALLGDGDLRGGDGAWRELAYLVASPAQQGKGLGTCYATMLLAFAFNALRCDRVYAAIVPHNIASRRVFDKLGYAVVSDAPTDVGDTGDVVLAISRDEFVERHAAAIAQIRITVR